MTIVKQSSGRYRARIWRDGKDVSVCDVLGIPNQTFPTQKAAKDAYAKARLALKGRSHEDVTVREWWERWTSQPAYARPKASTNRHNRDSTKQFLDWLEQGRKNLPMSAVKKTLVAEWRESGAHDGTIPALRAMWNDAIHKAGIVEHNPWARLGLKQTKGNRDVDPPSQEMVWKLIHKARELTPPGFAGWLQVAAFTGMRPGELDALKWDRIDWDAGEIRVLEQFSAVSRTFTLPKNGHTRQAVLTVQAREALEGLPRESEFCFTNSQRKHWTTTSRLYWWQMVRNEVGYEGSLYLATRHFAGHYMYEVLGFPAEDVAIALGHEDGGYLVRSLYGHRDKRRALREIREAYEGRSNVVTLVRKAESA